MVAIQIRNIKVGAVPDSRIDNFLQAKVLIHLNIEWSECVSA